jgi:hypothetical protein
VTNANDIAALVDRLRIWGEGADNQPDEDCLLAAAALESQARRIAELEKDAERYRWLRDQFPSISPAITCQMWSAERDRWENFFDAASLDAAIDAALSSGKGETT